MIPDTYFKLIEERQQQVTSDLSSAFEIAFIKVN
jgi:hypothetical protein